MVAAPPSMLFVMFLIFFSCSCPTLKGSFERLPAPGTAFVRFQKSVKLIMARLGRSYYAQTVDGSSITSHATFWDNISRQASADRRSGSVTSADWHLLWSLPQSAIGNQQSA